MFWGLFFFFFFTGPSSLGCVYEVTVGCSLFKATAQSVNLTLQQLYFPDWERCKTWATHNWKAKKAFFYLQHMETYPQLNVYHLTPSPMASLLEFIISGSYTTSDTPHPHGSCESAQSHR